jgi:hypothetical protein
MTAPASKARVAASQFATAAIHSFTTPHETSIAVKPPRLGSPGHPARMGERPAKDDSGTLDRSEWTRLPCSPDFYNSEKVLRCPPRTLFSRVSY